eukprot:TRINITY_DN1123_c0_g1_i1.p1 TRINITY_DN1123_c0_g1~~TRINITY_DN1123_c0_g1_i1.p1  ORF type:complete len:304 (+),score=91.81 TRINITY_DN1123_c0_g1_i1:257-1168(+)
MEAWQLSWKDVVQFTKDSQSPLILRVLMERKRMAMEKPVTIWIDGAIEMFEPVLMYNPAPNREFDILSLWFGLLEVIADSRFVLTKSEQANTCVKNFLEQLNSDVGAEILSIFTGKKFAFRVTEQIPIVFLAAKAIVVYLNRMLMDKNMANSGMWEKEYRTSFENLMKLSSKFPQEHFSYFFQEMKNLSGSRTWPLNLFEASIIRTLLPIAPYMMKTINLDRQDITWCLESGMGGEEGTGTDEEEEELDGWDEKKELEQTKRKKSLMAGMMKKKTEEKRKREKHSTLLPQGMQTSRKNFLVRP